MIALVAVVVVVVGMIHDSGVASFIGVAARGAHVRRAKRTASSAQPQ